MSKRTDGALARLYIKVYSHPRLVSFLNAVSYITVAFGVCEFALYCAYLLLGNVFTGVRFAISAAIPFLLVSLVRHFINRRRPYEIYDFEEFGINPPQHRVGRSFPSRHVFSAFIIGVIIMPYSVHLGVMTLIGGVFLAAARVLLGIHFPTDVIAGAALGIFFGAAGILIL